MPVKVFILGLPGSGKSAACRLIRDYLLQYKEVKHITHLSDYDILWEMALDDLQFNPPELRSFEFTREYSGFNVKPHAYAKFDEALRRINAKMSIWLSRRQEQWFLIEFARDDYHRAFRMFDPSLLRDAHFLFIESHKELCRRRIHERTKHPQTEDDHFVSDLILDTYYKRLAPLNIVRFCEEYHLTPDQVDILSNNDKLKFFTFKVQLFASRTLRFQEQLSLPGKPLH